MREENYNPRSRTGAKRLSVLEKTLIIPKRRKRYRLRKTDFAAEYCKNELSLTRHGAKSVMRFYHCKG